MTFGKQGFRELSEEVNKRVVSHLFNKKKKEEKPISVMAHVFVLYSLYLDGNST